MSLLKEYLPVLQHMARFPRANVDVVARKYGCSGQNVLALVKEHFGGLDCLDESTLREVCELEGVALEANGSPETEASAGAPVIDRRPREMAPPADRPGDDVAATVDLRTKWRGFGRIRVDAMTRYLALMRLVVDLGYAVAREKIQEYGLNPGAFSMFKSKYFGRGVITREAAQTFIDYFDPAGVSETLGVPPRAPVRRTTSPPNAEVAPAPANANGKGGFVRLTPPDNRARARNLWAASYRPGNKGNPKLSFTVKTTEELAWKIDPARNVGAAFIEYNPETHALRIIPTEAAAGVFIARIVRGALRIESTALREALGDAPMTFDLQLNTRERLDLVPLRSQQAHGLRPE